MQHGRLRNKTSLYATINEAISCRSMASMRTELCLVHLMRLNGEEKRQRNNYVRIQCWFIINVIK